MSNGEGTYKTLDEYRMYVLHEKDHGREPPVLILDNDQAAAWDEGRNTDLFDTDPYTLLRQALDLLGIPHDEV